MVAINLNSLLIYYLLKLSERKEELHRKVILMANLGLRDQMKEAINVISDWNWSVSGGPGFFSVNRPLLSGVKSQYFVITVLNSCLLMFMVF